MFKCNNCKATFENYDTIIENNGEKWYVCPFCRGTDFDSFEDYKVCELCGDLFLAEDSKHNECCQSCADIIVDRFKESYCRDFKPFERDVINTELDGKDLLFYDN